MSILSLIRDNYEFGDISWLKTDSILQTSRGLKRVLYWEDEDLLQWHFHLREQLSGFDQVLVDRMILTKSGEMTIKVDDKWLTCHDESHQRYPLSGNENVWGHFIGTLLSRSSNESIQDKRNENMVDSFEEGMDRLRDLKTENWSTSYDILIKCLSTVKDRCNRSLNLSDKKVSGELPYTAPFADFSKAKRLFGQLFWQAGQQQPEVGYTHFINFLAEWYVRTNNGSFFKLMNAIDIIFPMREKHGQEILAKLLYPSEWLTCLRDLKAAESPGQIKKVLAQFEKDWDEKKQLTALIGVWLEQDRAQEAK